MRFVFVVAARLSFCLRFGRRLHVLLLLLFCFLRGLSLSLSVSAPLSLLALACQLIVRNISDCAVRVQRTNVAP